MLVNDTVLRENLVMHLEAIIANIEAVIQLLPTECQDVQTLQNVRRRAVEYVHCFLSTLHQPSDPPSAINTVQISRTGYVGRPSIIVNIEQVELLRGVGYSWDEVSRMLTVSRSTLWRRFHELNIPTSKYSDISDHDLDQKVHDVQHSQPNCGLVMIQGHLASQGTIVQRRRLRESVRRLNPLGPEERWHQAISRRSYSVPGPNSLWHIDGHHSLIRWRFVVHGCIDGFSRLITYLSCATNNKASTVFDLFVNAVKEFGVPSRVRSDKGGENTQVCHFMVSYRGPGRGSHIAGSSTRNQRIERLWRDVYRCVCSTFHEVFYYLEAQNVLDPDDENDLFLLHCVFLPVVNAQLLAFMDAWNQHPIRTEHNWTPKRMWINGMIMPSNRDQTAVRDVVDGTPDVDVDDFGVDLTAPLAEDEQHTVVVPETLVPLSTSGLERFLHSLGSTTSITQGVVQYINGRERLQLVISA